MNRKKVENLLTSVENETVKKSIVDGFLNLYGDAIEQKDTKIATLENDVKVKTSLIDELNTKLKKANEVDIEALKKEQYDLGKADGSKEVETFKKTNALEKALANTKAKDSSLLAKLIDNESLTYEEKDGKFEISGLDDQIAKIKESNPYLFQEGGTNVDLGGTHVGGNGEVDLEKMSYEDYKKWRESN